MSLALIAAKTAQSHLKALELFPDDPNEAVDSLACFIANCILSTRCDPQTFYNRVDDFLAMYNAIENRNG